MIPNYEKQKEQKFDRLDLKTTEQHFVNIIIKGTNCSRFESEIITQKAKELFRFDNFDYTN